MVETFSTSSLDVSIVPLSTALPELSAILDEDGKRSIPSKSDTSGHYERISIAHVIDPRGNAGTELATDDDEKAKLLTHNLWQS